MYSDKKPKEVLMIEGGKTVGTGATAAEGDSSGETVVSLAGRGANAGKMESFVAKRLTLAFSQFIVFSLFNR